MAYNILVPIDFSEVTDNILAEALRLAKAFDAKIWLIHVATAGPDLTPFEIEVGVPYPRDDAAKHLHHEHQKLHQYQEMLRGEGLEVTAMLVPGSPAEKILQEARRLKPDVIVLGSHGHGAMHHLLVGDICEDVLKQSTWPLLVVPSKTAARNQ